MLTLKSQISNSQQCSHSSVTNVSSAHLHFQAPEPAVSAVEHHLPYRITQYYLPPDTNEFILPHIWEKSQTSAYTAITFWAVKPVSNYAAW